MWASAYRDHPFWSPGRLVEDGTNPYPLRRGGRPWPPRGGGPRSLYWRALPWAFMAARLVMPVLLLTILLGAGYLYSDRPLSGPPELLMVSDLVLPIAFISVHLTNRRYGSDYAFAQLVAALVLAGLVMAFGRPLLAQWLATLPIISSREILSFGAAFFCANLVGIVLFELARGPNWWLSPLTGLIGNLLIFSLIYYPLAKFQPDWTSPVQAHLPLFLVESLVLLLPYGLLRPAMRPLYGLNGY